MADIIDRAILLGMGLEKRLKGLVDEVVEEGKSGGTEGEEGEKLPPRKEFENRLVEEGVQVFRELVETVRGGKEKVDSEIHEVAERFAERCKVATKEDIEVIQKMAQVAREKVDRLEKRVAELEKELGKRPVKSEGN
ncbi:MAG: accessory factor UbiK family protein [Thermodesulfobacteriota bacterium]